jgi:D-alanyl-D-alanine carboxypeptidase/D-alanyl-D-alanine-endopeptidase (penicillin-binding protein 4)
MTNFLNDKGLNQSDVRILEGSGLSSQNKMTPEAMITILDKFKPYASMLPKTDGQFIKTGTLTGVYSYAGYFVEAEKKHSFVLILNQTKNTRSKILKSLKKIFKQKI